MSTPETIGARLDRLYPAFCLCCEFPYKRSEAKRIDGASRNICARCGLDQTGPDAGLIARIKRVKYSSSLL
jgi:hypothetical protein